MPESPQVQDPLLGHSRPGNALSEDAMLAEGSPTGDTEKPAASTGDEGCGVSRDGAIEQFLAGRDAPCPSCGYNLRDGATPNCPECGRTFALAVCDPHPLWRRRAALLLVFLWLLTVGTFAGIREGLSIYQTATPQGQFVTVFTTQNAPTPQTVGGTVMRVPFPPGTPQNVNGRIQWSGGSVQLGSVRGGQGLVWSLISWRQWQRLAVFSAIGLIGVLGLVLMFRYRRTAPSQQAARLVVGLACAGVGLSILHEAYLLVRDLV